MHRLTHSKYNIIAALKDECVYATLTQLATAPLTAFYGMEKSQQKIGDSYTIHLVGAELQFEADTLDKWETFFLHLVPQLVELRVVFIGPELNTEKLPLEILSRIRCIMHIRTSFKNVPKIIYFSSNFRMCRMCRQDCKVVKFDFQCDKLYVDYVKSGQFIKPDLGTVDGLFFFGNLSFSLFEFITLYSLLLQCGPISFDGL